MASGSFVLTNTGQTSRYVQIRVDWADRKSSLVDNASVVDIVVTCVKLQGSTAATSGKYNMTINLDGNVFTIPNTSFSVQPRSSIELANMSFSGIRHNADGTKQCNLSVDVGGNVMWANGSQTITLDTFQRYVTLNANMGGRDEKSVTINWSTDRAINKLWYSTNDGSSWNEIASTGTSGSFNINGLNANTYYPFKVKVRAADSGLDTISSTIGVYTYNLPNATSADNVLIGASSVNLTFYNPLSRTITYTLKDATGGTLGTGTTSSTSAIVSLTGKSTQLYNSIPNSKTSAFTCVCDTTIDGTSYSKTTSVGSYTIVESDCLPTISGIALLDANSTTIAMTGDDDILVSYYSRVYISVMGISFKNGADVGSVKAYVYDLNSTPITLNYSNGSATKNNNIITYSSDYSPNKNMYIVVEDSRGVKQTFTQVMNIYEYTPVYASSSYVKRQSNFYSDTDFYLKAEITNIGNNASSVRTRYKKVEDANWSNWVSMSSGVVKTITLDNEYAWQYEIEYSDALTSSTTTGSIQRGTPLMFIDTMNNRVGINCFPENPFEVEKAPVNTNLSDTRVACGLLDGNYVYRQCEYGDVSDVIDFNDRSMAHLIVMLNAPQWITDVIITTYDTDSKKFRKITPTNVQYLNSSILVEWVFPSDLDEYNSKYLVQVYYTISVG